MKEKKEDSVRVLWGKVIWIQWYARRVAFKGYLILLWWLQWWSQRLHHSSSKKRSLAVNSLKPRYAFRITPNLGYYAQSFLSRHVSTYMFPTWSDLTSKKIIPWVTQTIGLPNMRDWTHSKNRIPFRGMLYLFWVPKRGWYFGYFGWYEVLWVGGFVFTVQRTWLYVIQSDNLSYCLNAKMCALLTEKNKIKIFY